MPSLSDTLRLDFELELDGLKVGLMHLNSAYDLCVEISRLQQLFDQIQHLAAGATRNETRPLVLAMRDFKRTSSFSSSQPRSMVSFMRSILDELRLWLASRHYLQVECNVQMKWKVADF